MNNLMKLIDLKIKYVAMKINETNWGSNYQVLVTKLYIIMEMKVDFAFVICARRQGWMEKLIAI